MSADYKGCFLDPKANELADGSGWTVELFIARPDGGSVVDTQYFIEGKFPSRDSAMHAAIESAKRLIDKNK